MTGISGWNTAMKGRDGFEQQKHQAGAGPVLCMGQPWEVGPRRWARTWIISPAMLTAISSGVTARMGVPMGVCTRSMED